MGKRVTQLIVVVLVVMIPKWTLLVSAISVDLHETICVWPYWTSPMNTFDFPERLWPLHMLLSSMIVCPTLRLALTISKSW